MFSSINFVKFDKHFESREMNYKLIQKQFYVKMRNPEFPLYCKPHIK